MPQKDCILIATIGTRDLAYQESSGLWLNVGHDRAKYGDSSTQESRVFEDLSTDPNVKGDPGNNFRSHTQYLSENFAQHQTRIQPIILGQLLHHLAPRLHKVYLIGTNQPENVQFRVKDTFYCAQIIQQWIDFKYGVNAQVVSLGNNGENPADFDEMVRWCKQHIWKVVEQEFPTVQEIVVSPKGGVNQFSEALRVTALSRHEKQAIFYDFVEDENKNSQGIPSDYKEPKRGTQYLWDLNQREAKAILERHDYAGVQQLLRPYLTSQDVNTQKLKYFLNSAILWNIADFDSFKSQIKAAIDKSYIAEDSFRLNKWWWSAYEAAYLGQIRFEQGNTIEALFHSFRAVEGLMSEWAINTYRNHMRQYQDGSLIVNSSIFSILPNYRTEFQSLTSNSHLKLYGRRLINFLEIARPEARNHADIYAFSQTATDWRNQLFHRLLGLQKNEVFHAWDTENKERWLARVINCLNFISGQNFRSLAEASFMSKVHKNLFDTITDYQP